jgi:hypothetical protein
MSFVNVTLLYLLFSRLTIVTAGAMSMVMGYRLFCHGIGMNTSKAKVPPLSHR